MISLEFMLRLRTAGISIWLDGDAVRFSAPRGAMTADLLDTLKSNKDAIREFLRRIPADAGQTAPAPPIEKAPRKGELPLSFAQQRLWFLDRLEPASAFYNVPAVVRLSGRLDVDALARSLQELVRRHEALRTAFPTTLGGEAHQAIAGALEVPFPIVDLQAFAEPVLEAEVRRRAEEEGQKPFDLARGPLLRTTLLRLGEQEHVLVLTMHHIVSDGWSMGVLVRELGALYEAFSRGLPSPLPELPIQYADYAVWQRAWLSGEVLEAQLAYWKKQLSGAPPALELPTDRPRPAV
ncbi:MAG TPA: condensation domain-containing protein, partial [Sorangium sp.]|nr:condensation domain-containing protein [Sorangium sp.]